MSGAWSCRTGQELGVRDIVKCKVGGCGGGGNGYCQPLKVFTVLKHY